MDGSLTVAAVAIAAALAACWLVLRWNRSSPWTAGARGLPPGSRGFPILGETLEFFSATPTIELIPFLKRRQERYGTIFRTNLVGENLIVSLDHELNNLVFQQEEKLFQIWYPESLMRILGDDNIVTMLGTLHKHVRVLVLRIFGPENLRRVLLHDVQTTARASLLSWLEHPSIELKEATSRMIFSITAKRLISYDSSTSDGKLWKQFDAFIRGLVSFPLYFPGTTFYKCMQVITSLHSHGRKNVLKTLKELLEERKKEVHQESIEFLDLLISDLKEERPVMSEKVALDLIFLLLFASFETTSSGIMVALKFLTDNPKALQELTEEDENILEKRNNPDSEITWEEYKSMKFTSHVIHEALRLANIAHVMFRKAIQDVHIKAIGSCFMHAGYTIPKGSKVMICPSAAHLDPEIYKDPNVFNPWRWKDIVEPMGGASKDFMAFGGGLRLCVGADFAKLQMATFLHCLVTKYRWKVVKGGTMVLSPGPRFYNGFHIQLLPKV